MARGIEIACTGSRKVVDNCLATCEDRYVTTDTARKSLEALNASFASIFTHSGYSLQREYRVGKWGVAVVTTQRGQRASQGQGGQNSHLMVVDVIAALPADFDARKSCQVCGPKYMRELR